MKINVRQALSRTTDPTNKECLPISQDQITKEKWKKGMEEWKLIEGELELQVLRTLREASIT
jgi:hypothetical protein